MFVRQASNLLELLEYFCQAPAARTHVREATAKSQHTEKDREMTSAPEASPVHTRPMSRRRFVTAALAGPALLGSAQGAFSQSYPNRPITMVVPFPAGSGTDTVARLVQPLLQAELNSSVVIDNRPGVNAAIGAGVVGRADPDGYTLLFTTSTSHSITPFVTKNVTYDPVTSFTPIGQVGVFPVILVAENGLNVRTVGELIARAKAEPGKLQYAYGNGTGQVAGAALSRFAGIDVLAVPYRGTPAAMTDLIAGRINYIFVDATTGLPHVRAGAVRALAVTTEEPSRLLPDLPTVAASGLPAFNLSAWCGLFAPAGLEPAVRDRLSQALAKAVAAPALRPRLEELGFELISRETGSFAQLVKSDVERWQVIIKEVGLAQTQ
ncbi:Bug family tripartite tricarboxylate transporter substrate binding protein [Phreatobacter stygius]|nr:tripartite tricarboxylate transporter substrate-binding protein [Phreatobacter stygius]